MLVGFIAWLRMHIRGLRNLLVAYLLALVVLDFLLARHHPHYWFDEVFAFWAAFGIAGCFLLIKASKGTAHLFLSKPEDYYGSW